MRLRLLPLGLLVAACAYAGALGPTPAPWKPKQPPTPAASARKIPKLSINGIPDTGQFLPDTTWLVKVGPRITRIGEFVTQFLGAYPEDRPREDSLGRVEFLNNIINRDVLGLTALALNRPLDFTDRASIREAEERALSDVFFLRYVVDSARVSEAEVEEDAKQRGAEAHFRHIVLGDLPSAERVRAELVSGKLKWTDAVSRYSLDKPTAERPDGDVGWSARGKLTVELGLPLFRLQPGGISEVFRSQQGYEIAQMLERRQKAAPAASAGLDFVRNEIRGYHVALLADSIQSLLRKRIGMAFDTTNIRFACSRFSNSMQVKREGYNTNIEISGAVPEFPPADTARALASWNDGGRYSLGEFLSWYSTMSPVVRPNVTFPDAMIAQINGVVLEPARASMARELGLDKDPEVVARISGKREKLLVEHMYEDSVASTFYVTRQERQAYYEKRKSDFVTYPAVDYAMIYRYNRAGADSLVKALDAGAKPWDILAADSLQGEKPGSIKHRAENEGGTYQKVLFEELRPGRSTVVGPDREGVYAVIHLIRYDPGHQLSFDESQGMIDESLQNIGSEERLKAWLVRLRKRYPIEWRPELVMRIMLAEKIAH